MNQSGSTFFFHCDTSPHLTNFVQFCLKSLCPNHHKNGECNECDMNTETALMSLLHELTGIDGHNVSNVNTCNFDSFIENAVSSFSSNDRLYFTKSLSIIIQHTHIQSFIHQITIQLLSQIMSCNNNWCLRLSDDISFINFIIKHIIDCNDNVMIYEYEIILQYISTNICVRKVPQIKYLINNFIECIIRDDEYESDRNNLPKLVTLYNIIVSKDGLSMQRHIKSLSNLKKLYKKLSRLMGNKNMWIVLYSLFIVAKLIINDALQSQLFHKNNINIVFQLIFNLILHGITTDIKMLEISIDLLSSMVANDTIFLYLANYPKLKKTVRKLFPLLLSNQYCLLILKFLNILMASNKIQLIVLKLLKQDNYFSVVLKLCLYNHALLNSDVNICIYAVKFLATTIKSQHLNDDLCEIFTCNSHNYPREADIDDIENNNSINFNLNANSNTNEQFVSDLRKMCFVVDACNILFGDTESEIKGNSIMRKLCFSGHIEDYSLLNQSQKYIMYFIELLNLLCRESNEFKTCFAELINIQDLAYFLCPYTHKHNKNSEPNQIFLSLINLICSLSEDIVGVSYLLKTSLCGSSLISSIINALNSRSNSKDISNAILFIHNIFKILSKQQQQSDVEAHNNSYISNLLQQNKSESGKRNYRKKQKPRHYGRGGLTLSNVNDNINEKHHYNDGDGETTISTDSNYSNYDINVQNMSGKILYQLFCKKMLRFNKTNKPNQAKIVQQAKQFENLKLKYSKTIKNKDDEIEKIQSELDAIKTRLCGKNNDFLNLRQKFDDLNAHFLQIQDDNQTKKHIIRDKIEKLDVTKKKYNKLKQKCAIEENKSNQLAQQMDEIMNKLKCVCEGYNKMKQDSINQINALENENKDIVTGLQEKCDKIGNELKDERNNVFKLENELTEKGGKNVELKKNLDCMIKRNSDLNYKYNQSNKEIVQLNQKLSETQKLVSMIQNLMSKNNDNNNT